MDDHHLNYIKTLEKKVSNQKKKFPTNVFKIPTLIKNQKCLLKLDT
jgi:hypothetical protein